MRWLLLPLCLCLACCVRAGFEQPLTVSPDGAMPPVDVSGADTPVDLGREDQDLTLADATVDQAVVPVDIGPPPPCAGGAAVGQTYAADMVLCASSSSTVANQCDAEATFCNVAGGWHLCTATEFIARGGATTASPLRAWIASSVRDGAAITAPTDAPCSSCVSQWGAQQDFLWSCTGIFEASNVQLRQGVAASGSCHRIGFNTAANGAYWEVFGAVGTTSAAVCCR